MQWWTVGLSRYVGTVLRATARHLWWFPLLRPQQFSDQAGLEGSELEKFTGNVSNLYVLTK